MRYAWLLALVAVGCADDELPALTTDPPPPPPVMGEGGPDMRFSRPPRRDMDLVDAALDGGADAADLAIADMAPAPDLAVDAAPDAAPDAALPDCADDPCVLAVRLSACDPCPVGLPGGYVATQRCTVLFNNAIPLFEYPPADCTAACPLDSLQFCNEAVGAALCEVDGQCVHAR